MLTNTCFCTEDVDTGEQFLCAGHKYDLFDPSQPVVPRGSYPYPAGPQQTVCLVCDKETGTYSSDLCPPCERDVLAAGKAEAA